MKPVTEVALAPFCTMGVGGAARWFAAAHTETDLLDALTWAEQHDVAVHVLGGGSNIVVADAGFDGLVVHVSVRGIARDATRGLRVFTAGAGEPWDALVAATVEENCAGLECLSGIPGLVGGTPVQNVGAYGQDVSGCIRQVRVVDRQQKRVTDLSNAECGFGYRSSRFKTSDAGRFIVTQVEFALTPDGAPTVTYADVVTHFEHERLADPSLADVRTAILAIRRRKGMVIEPGNIANRSCGSFFVNPVVTREDLSRVEHVVGTSAPHYVVGSDSVKIPAAWLIEHAGFARGVRRGPVGISPFQAQALINYGDATAADVLALAHEVKRAVWKAFSISIVPEPVFVGFAPSPELHFLRTPQGSH